MMMRTVCMVVTSMAALSGFARAQEAIDLSNVPGVLMPPIGDSYGARAVPVYSNGHFPDPYNVAAFANTYDVLDEVDFSGTAWAGVAGRTITQMNFGIGQFGAGTPGIVRFSFYNAITVDAVAGNGTPWSAYNSTGDILGGLGPSAVLTVSLGVGGGIYMYFTVNTALPLPDGTDRFYVRLQVLNSDLTPWTGAANAYLPLFANDLTIGQGVTDCAFNNINYPVDGNGVAFTGNPAPGRGFGIANTTGQTQEHRNFAVPPSLSGSVGHGANSKGLNMTISGDIILTDPPGTTDLGILADGCHTYTAALADNQIKYYRITIDGDANDSANQFLDIDTEGSAVDTSLALWRCPDGTKKAEDADDGSGSNAQLTFGMGRRNAIGDGRCYDGRDGELYEGTYILAVAAGNASFGPAYNGSTTAPGGAVTLHICTNANGSALAGPVPPCLIDSTYDLGDLARPTAEPPVAVMDPDWVVWYKFNLCTDVVDDNNAASQGTYVDFDFGASFPGSDTDVVIIRDATDAGEAGVFIAEDDDSGSGFFSQFSFGDVAPARSALGDGLPFAGQNGSLLAGTYYMAVGLCCATYTPSRWHVRTPYSEASLPAQFSIFTNGLTACGPCGCIADANGDGGIDGGDVEAFFNDWIIAAPCSDTNNDGGVDGGDVESFFAVWSAGSC